MKLALESPINLLEDIQPLADFDWILADEVIKSPEYALYYKNSKRLKVLDNSVNELGIPLGINWLIETADKVSADYIVSPDWLGDAEKTFECYREFSKKTLKYKILPVLQGKDIDECITYAYKYKDCGGEYICIPYDICCNRHVSTLQMCHMRFLVVNGIWKMFKCIHLLGMTCLEEFGHYLTSGITNIKSVDTGYPISCGMYGFRFGKDELPDKSKCTWDHFKEANSVNSYNIYYNIAYLRRLINAI